MRPVALGRKNWLHISSPEVGPKVAELAPRRLEIRSPQNPLTSQQSITARMPHQAGVLTRIHLNGGAQGEKTAGCRWRSGLDFLDESDEAMSLVLNAFVEFRIGEISRGIQRLVNLRYENPGWENMRVAVAKNLL